MSKASKHNQNIFCKNILYKRVLTIFCPCAGFWRVWLLAGFERSRSIITSMLITRWCIFIGGCDHPVLCCTTQPCTAPSSTWWRRSSYSEYSSQTTSFMLTWCLELKKVAPLRCSHISKVLQAEKGLLSVCSTAHRNQFQTKQLSVLLSAAKSLWGKSLP